MPERLPPLWLYNTLTRKTERFKPREPGLVKMFTCGPSVYKPQHLGNYRTFLYEDILHRYLRYLGYRVQRVINFTDVEDKTLREAEAKGVDTLDAVTGPVIEQFFNEAAALQISIPDTIPRSSTSVDTAVEIIRRLIQKGHAYHHNEEIFYDPLTFSGFGKLYGLDMSRWPRRKIRFSKDTYPGQRWNLGDFILWHGCPDNQLGCWDTALGLGRPAWNVQDPAMILKHLGAQLDIHCGGIDNLYRHHDYTIAVLEGYSGKKLANYWLHGEHLLVDGEKMAKKKGNVIHVADLFEKGISASDIRFFLIDGYYRAKKNCTEKSVRRCCERRMRLLESFSVFRVNSAIEGEPDCENMYAGQLLEAFEKSMSNDLQINTAIDSLLDSAAWIAKRANTLSERDRIEATRAFEKINTILCIAPSGE